jgi:hypothetical protein
MSSKLTAYRTVAVACSAVGLCTACFSGGGAPLPPPPPPIAISTPSDFGFTATTGLATAPQLVSIINTTNHQLALAAPRLVLNQGQAFRITTTCGKLLAANAQCTVSAIFQPPARGNFHATIEVKLNRPYESQYIYLAGSTSTPASTAP